MKGKDIFLPLAFAVCILCSCGSHAPEEGEHRIDIYVTNDVHGRYFDSLYVGSETKSSLLAVNEYMKGVREEKGTDNVLLIDVGDLLQGDNAAYYFNYVDTLTKHVSSRMAEYMGYDAMVVGNHDVETSHAVYDRVRRQLDIPLLAGNAIRDDNGKPYFQPYAILEKGGVKVAVLGYTNPNIKAWLSREIWEGMHFEDLMKCVQADVDAVRKNENPQVVIVAAHSGTGKGDGSELESQGLDLLHSLSGVDFVLCSHDHRACVVDGDGCVLLNSGSHCRKLAHGSIVLDIKDGEVVSKTVAGELVDIDKTRVDEEMREYFYKDYETVREFTLRKVGELDMPLDTRTSFVGMNDYMNLIHVLCLSCEPAQLSFAAPLTFNGHVDAGTVIYNDLFTIYPYENQIFVVRMKGREIENYLEYSYEQWINTWQPGGRVLKIQQKEDQRTSSAKWSFVNRSYNFDSLGGAFYTVDVTKPYGDRVEITSLADGTPFDPEADYNVAMTSYRANGGGDLMREGAGIDTNRLDERIVERYPEVRELLYNYFSGHRDMEGEIAPVTSDELSYPSVIGAWKFVPEDIAAPALAKDFKLLF